MKIFKLITIIALIFHLGCDVTESKTVWGCTDNDARNYDDAATNDDGSCYYGEVLFINEFMASNDSFIQDPDDSGVDPYDDWIEIYNPNTYDVDIAGMYLADGHVEGHEIMAGGRASTVIPGGGYLVVWFDDESDDGNLHIPEKLGGDGDSIYLYNTDGITLIDSLVSYIPQYSDVTMIRPVMDDPEDLFYFGDRDNWEFSMQPTPGAVNISDLPVFGCTDPDAVNFNANADLDDDSCIIEGVYINELYEDGEWIEIYNGTSSAIDLGGMHIELDGENMELPVGTGLSSIAPFEYMVLYVDEGFEDDGFPHLEEDLTLKAYGGEVILYEADGVTIIDEVTYPEQADPDKGWGRFPDGTDIWKATDPTAAAANEFTPDVELIGVLVINEFMASSNTCCDDGFGEFEDFVELYNSSASPIDIGGMYVSDDLTDLMKAQIPEGSPDVTTIQPGGFLVVWFDSHTEQGPLHVQPKLSSGGEDVVLTDTDGTTIIDSYSFDAQTTDVSYGRQPDGSDNWIYYDPPNPGVTNP